MRKMQRIVVGLFTVACVLVGVVHAADASTGPVRLQKRAEAQTELLLRNLTGDQVTSPLTCNGDQRPQGTMGTFLLPTLSFSAGNATLTCDVKAPAVLLDLGGAVVTEDNDAPYVFEDGTELLFTPQNLERICDDVLVRFFPEQPAVALVDGVAIQGTQVSTGAFVAEVQPGTAFYEESVQLGHPGTLAAAYCGWKTELRLRRGSHVITVDLSALTGSETRLTYNLTVR